MTDLSEYDAVLFDLDGVLTPTADVHMRAWDALFTHYFAEHNIESTYTENDYFVYVDGKPRYEGVASLLKSRNIELPWGTPNDAPTAITVCGLGNRKNVEFTSILTRDGVAPYPGSLALLDQLKAAGVPLAVVSSSQNAESVLAAAGLRDRFRAVVDGAVAAHEGLPGKPAPDTFLRAATLLGVTPDRAVVVEDAISGVAAGAAGHFGLVIGVDRGVGHDALATAGANVVVSDLAELTHTSDSSSESETL